jgi:hypothetical protein
MDLRYPFNPQAPERYPKRRSGSLASIESRVTPRTKKPYLGRICAHLVTNLDREPE